MAGTCTRAGPLILVAFVLAFIVRQWTTSYSGCSVVSTFPDKDQSITDQVTGLYIIAEPSLNQFVYVKHSVGLPLSFAPDIWRWLDWSSIVWNRRDRVKRATNTTIMIHQNSQEQAQTAFKQLPTGKVLAISDPSKQEKLPSSSYQWPHSGEWFFTAKDAQIRQSLDISCFGASLTMKRMKASYSSSGGNGFAGILGKLMQQPVTTCILAICGIVHWLIRSERLSPNTCVGSYKLIAIRGELWRGITAAFTHINLSHLFMNGFSLYNLGFIEPMLGSTMYATYTLVILITIPFFDCVLRYFVAKLTHREQILQQPYVGYSGVLFTWAVVAAAQLPNYCLFPGLPQWMCIPTWDIPLPESYAIHVFGLGTRLPINLGPLLLLIILQLLVKNVSFYGHLAGFLVGFSVLWGILTILPITSSFALMMFLVTLSHLAIVQSGFAESSPVNWWANSCQQQLDQLLRRTQTFRSSGTLGTRAMHGTASGHNNASIPSNNDGEESTSRTFTNHQSSNNNFFQLFRFMVSTFYKQCGKSSLVGQVTIITIVTITQCITYIIQLCVSGIHKRTILNIPPMIQVCLVWLTYTFWIGSGRIAWSKLYSDTQHQERYQPQNPATSSNERYQWNEQDEISMQERSSLLQSTNPAVSVPSRATTISIDKTKSSQLIQVERSWLVLTVILCCMWLISTICTLIATICIWQQSPETFQSQLGISVPWLSILIYTIEFVGYTLTIRACLWLMYNIYEWQPLRTLQQIREHYRFSSTMGD